jgi:lysophospholipase L1-like esterase
LALGNSCTFGWGVTYEECWTKLLEDRLNKIIAPDAEVINAGIPGYSSHQGRILFNELLSLQPDVVLIMFGWNDHWRAGQDISDAEQKSPPELILKLQNTFSRLRLYKLMRQVMLTVSEDTTIVRMGDINGKRRVSPDEFFENLKAIVTLARQNGIKPVLLIPPIASLENYQLGAVSPLHLLHQRYQEQVLRASQYLMAPVVDLQSVFDRHRDLFDDPLNDPIHFNERGHLLAAESIFSGISSAVLPKADSLEN